MKGYTTMTTGMATVSLAAMRTMLERGRLAAATDDLRPVLAGIHFVISKRSIQAIAADGFALMVHRMECETSGEGDGIMHLTDVKALLKALPRPTKQDAGADVEIMIEAGRIFIECENARWSYNCIAGTHPNMAKLIPRGIDGGATSVIGIDGRYLERAGKLARLGTGSGTVRIHLPDGPKKPMVFTVRDGDDSIALMVVMPMFIDPINLDSFVREALNEATSPDPDTSDDEGA